MFVAERERVLSLATLVLSYNEKQSRIIVVLYSSQQTFSATVVIINYDNCTNPVRSTSLTRRCFIIVGGASLRLEAKSAGGRQRSIVRFVARACTVDSSFVCPLFLCDTI